ncbi:MAG: hypothetical protein FWG25_02440 [Promicromonosporaceae bacterium]|nr:hypothetical protein [Promicromonosporaceae bacterium]
MRFLLLSTPYQGHISPTFSLARELISLGHQVDYLTNEKWAEEVRETGAGLITYPQDEADLAGTLSKAYQTAIAHKGDYDSLIFDEFNFTGRALADDMGIPGIRFFPCVAMNERIIAPMLQGNGVMRIFSDPKVLEFITNSVREQTGNSDISDTIDEAANRSPALNVVFVSEWFQPDIETFPRDKYKFVGPSIRETTTELPSWLQIDSTRPLVYLALGTIDNMHPDLYRKFLSAFEDIPANFILSVGDQVQLSDLGEIPANCQVYPVVPQNAILGVADLFITHGGMNSVNEALVNGVPMIVVPLSNDQPINAEQVARLGNGLTSDPDNLDVESIVRLVNTALNDDEMKSRAKELQGRLAGRDGGIEAAREINTFLSSQQPS